MTYTLYFHDYFSGEEINYALVEYGYELVSRKADVLSTTVVVEDVEGDWDILDVVSLLQNEFYVTIEVRN